MSGINALQRIFIALALTLRSQPAIAASLSLQAPQPEYACSTNSDSGVMPVVGAKIRERVGRVGVSLGPVV